MSKSKLIDIIDKFYQYLEQYDEVMFGDIRKAVISSPNDRRLLNLICLVQEKPYIFKFDDHFEVDTHDREPKHRIEKLRDFIADLEEKYNKINDQIEINEINVRKNKNIYFNAKLMIFHNLVRDTCRLLKDYDIPLPQFKIRNERKKSTFLEVVHKFYSYLELISTDPKRISPSTHRCCFTKQDIRKNVVLPPSDKNLLKIIFELQEKPYIYVKPLGKSKYLHLKLSTEYRDSKKRYYQIREIVNNLEFTDIQIRNKMQNTNSTNKEKTLEEYTELLNSYQRLFTLTIDNLEKLRAQIPKEKKS